MNRTVLYLLIFITLRLQAQPGGGGGLIINKVYDENLKEISLSNNSLKIELLELDSVMTILNKYKIDNKETLYLPPLNRFRPSNKASGILITYQNQEYRIDFENIYTQNGAGVKEKIDSVVLFKPYILSKRSYAHPLHDGNEFQNYFLLNDVSLIYRQNGVTPNTYDKLSELDLMFGSKDYAYNRKPKPWMGDFKNLYEKYRASNYSHEEKEIKYFINELEEIIKQYGINDAFVLLKIKLLYEIKSYKETISLYEKYPFEYDNLRMHYLNNLLIDSYVKSGNYNKAKQICDTLANKQLIRSTEYSYIYRYHKFFIEIYYQNIDRKKAIQTLLDNEKYKQYYDFVFDQLKILQSYCVYKFENKEIGINQMNTYDKKCIPYPILKKIYPSVIITETSDDFCGSLVFGIMRDIL